MNRNSPKAAWIAKHLGDPQMALFTSADLAVLEPHLKILRLRANSTLFAEGEVPSGVWVIREGEVGMFVGDAIIALLGPGACTGDAQVLVNGASPFGARTLTDAMFLHLSGQKFRRLLTKVPAVAQRWVPKLAVQLVRAQLRVSELLGSNLTEQAARVLLNESVDDVFPHSQETLADMLGTHRSPLNQVLKELERQGLVELGYRKIQIRKAKQLGKIAGNSSSL